MRTRITDDMRDAWSCLGLMIVGIGACIGVLVWLSVCLMCHVFARSLEWLERVFRRGKDEL